MAINPEIPRQAVEIIPFISSVAFAVGCIFGKKKPVENSIKPRNNPVKLEITDIFHLEESPIFSQPIPEPGSVILKVAPKKPPLAMRKTRLEREK